MPDADPFFEPYDREDIAYGSIPSSAVDGYLQQAGTGGLAYDLGAGAGRDTLALAKFENGLIDEAIHWQTRALDDCAESAKDRYMARLEKYRAAKRTDR